MSKPVTDINKETTLNRLLRDNSMLAMFLAGSGLFFLNGIVLGFVGFKYEDQATQCKKLADEYEVYGILQQNVLAELRVRGIEIKIPEVDLESKE